MAVKFSFNQSCFWASKIKSSPIECVKFFIITHLAFGANICRQIFIIKA